MAAQASFFAALKGTSLTVGKETAGGPAWDKSLQAAKDALGAARKFKDDVLIAKALTFVAQNYVMMFQLDDAKTHIDEGCAVCLKCGFETGEAYLRALMTQMYFMHERHDATKDPGTKA